jgi:SAM-dependent methyltransferase
VNRRGAGTPAPKRYDAEYFERWYRRSAVGVGRQAFVARKVRLALAAADFVLGRPARSVLDVGCGEGPWRAILRRLRPGLAYVGVDSSEYAVRRHGRRRNLRLGRVGELERLGLARRYDLVVCSDVLHYVPEREARAALRSIAMRAHGVAFVEAFTSTDAIEGDRHEFQARTPEAWGRLFAGAGLLPLGLHLFVTRARARTLVALERGLR